MISASHLMRRFDDRVAVDDVTFEVAAGEVFGLLGPNGAGKTTTLRMLGGLILPTSGTVRIGGVPLDRSTAGALRGRIGFLTETPGLWEQLTVAENLRVYARLFGVPRVSEAIDRSLALFALDERRNDRAALLSKGMKQKLAVARALLHDPEIVLLDEPTANLDPQAARAVRDLLLDLRRRGRAVVVSTHNLDEVERLADRIGVIRTRLMAEGAPATLRRQIFGRRLRVRLAPGSAPAEDLARAARDAGALDVTVAADALSIGCDDPDRDVPRVLAALVAAGAAVREAFDERVSLEDVYLRLLEQPSTPAEVRM